MLILSCDRFKIQDTTMHRVGGGVLRCLSWWGDGGERLLNI